jgi:IS4 transposase
VSISVAANLSEAEFSFQEIGELYRLCWGVETAFDMLKNQL